MQTVQLASKLIDAVEYDEYSHHLRIYLSNGQRREYDGVSAGVVKGLLLAASPGRFYMSEIKGRYECY